MKYLKRKDSLPGWLLVLLMPVLDELMLHCWITDTMKAVPLLCAMGFGLVLGAALALPVSLIADRKVQKWVAVVLSLILTVLYMMEYFLNDAYQVFMSIGTILDGADGVMSDYGDLIVSLVTRNLWRIGLALLPIILFAVFSLGASTNWKHRIGIAVCGVAAAAIGFVASGSQLTTTYNFDNAVRNCGLAPALIADLLAGGGRTGEPEFVVVQPATEAVPVNTEESGSAQASESTEAVEEPVVYEKNVMDFDFAELAATEKSTTIAAIHNYVASLTPSSQNAYTGLFAGKNLIFITAEAFSAEVIDPELTPTLYRLATEGIQFTEYYQPLWGGSTSTGEFSNLTSLVAANGTASIKESIQQDLFLTIGNQLMKLGYHSAAYHNHSYTYYDRHLTHVGLGYATFTGIGNGMEESVKDQWPQSDLEMMEYSVAQYIDQQPFSVYYMTVSGHALYNSVGNAMGKKNYEAVQHLECSHTVKCYLATQLELEYALEYLVAQLEEAGIADDTVIVLATDHYPYALEKSSTWYNDKDYLSELYGYRYSNQAERDHNALIIWSGCIEDMDIVVDEPVYSLDILPTLSNLFGVDYDSRLLVGRDVFSDQEALVLWPDFDWKTEKGYYEFGTDTFTPEEGVEVDEGYVEYISSLVKNKISFSKSVQNNNYYNYLSELLVTETTVDTE